MQDAYPKVCNNCGTPVTYYVIDDNNSPGVIEQFGGISQTGSLAGLPVVIDHCPNPDCNQVVTLESTSDAPKSSQALKS